MTLRSGANQNFLKDGGDAGGLRRRRDPAPRKGLAADKDAARIGLHDTRQEFYQSAFARAVLTQDRVDGSGSRRSRKTDVLEGFRFAVVLRKALDGQHAVPVSAPRRLAARRRNLYVGTGAGFTK